MELLQCVSSDNRSRGLSLGRNPTLNRPEDRYVSQPNHQEMANRMSTSLTPEFGGRRVSLPSGHYSVPPSRPKGKSEFHHYGSSLSLTNGATADLTTRTLRPPSPTTLRKSSTISNGSSSSMKTLSRPSLPSTKVDLESPRLADYLERPRLVSTLNCRSTSPTMNKMSSSRSAAEASHHHAKRMMNNTSQYRNLRLGNFMEGPEEEELIPERLRQYYLETYLNVCDTCESLTHSNPVSPIQRGM